MVRRYNLPFQLDHSMSLDVTDVAWSYLASIGPSSPVIIWRGFKPGTEEHFLEQPVLVPDLSARLPTDHLHKIDHHQCFFNVCIEVLLESSSQLNLTEGP